MKIKENILETIGHTPLVKIQRLNQSSNANVYVKPESFNPGGSVKDRIALNMIESALKSGAIQNDTTIIEPTSGNTGIGLAMVCAAKGMKLIIVMPDTMSVERRKLIQIFGAELVLTDGALGMKGAIEKANELHAAIQNSFIPMQFENKDNPMAHEMNTAHEIYEDLDGHVDVLVAGVGTGGTITGNARFLKAKNPDIRIIAVEPQNSAVLSGQSAGKHKIQGIGAGFIPEIYDASLVDEIIQVSDEAAIQTARELARKEGILAGISAGAAMSAALRVAERAEMADKNIVVILPDSAERYLSCDLFE